MHGLVTLLEDQYYKAVEDIWHELRRDCGVFGIEVTPFPHFSWMIAEDYDQEAMQQALDSLAAEAKPFTIKTTGIALFTGEAPVVYIPLTRNAELSAFHAKVWERLFPHLTGASLLYHPNSWMPHISLAYTDVSPENLDCVMQKLAFKSFNWELSVDNFSFISEPDGDIGILQYQFPFGK